MATARKLLVPIDGSDCALNALRYAAERRRECQDVEVVVLHVQPLMRPSRVVTRDLIVEHQERNAQGVLKPARTLMKRLKLDAQIQVLTGEPAPVIVQFGKKKGCGEIVMGNNGLGQIAGMVLGSVARKVVHLAKGPVTLVK